MTIKIEIVVNDGSPIGVTSKTVWGDAQRIGLGGAELALITMCEAWKERGDEVILYNDPWEANASPFEQRPISSFDPNSGEHDVVIFFRSPPLKYPMFLGTSGLKVWWSCDQQTQGDYQSFSKMVHKIVCISQFHSNYFASRYGITNSIVIDLPVRTKEFENPIHEKIPNRIAFTSVPARGLDNLHRIWDRILERIPDATLTITSDYRLWGVGASNEWAIVKWMKKSNVLYMGALPRKQYLDELAKAQILLYPSNYDELFCIAVAEAQVAGLYPITSGTGALPTTNMGIVISGNADDVQNDTLFIDETVNKLNSGLSDEIIQDVAIERFSLGAVLSQWDEQVFI